MLVTPVNFRSSEGSGEGRHSWKATDQQATKPGVPVEKPTCPNCGRQHAGKCLKGTGVCYRCKHPGHKIYQCPQAKQPATGRVYVMQAEEADPDTTLIQYLAPYLLDFWI
ncbi:hypothetical protein F511_46662 [Dorcoceras hygrometricum]|uniref:CCHC-type domain-containing protein n=1 Tax=Dorcoceras hygrometricum TaxID=472368 RepID=A0A2Z6ZZR7_9LAMI|nr:hypothetical protein F511_46662 [Dorcoceras hygrometricum]